MPSVCFYFELHQPYRLKPYGTFQVGRDHEYFDAKLNAEVLRKGAAKCYLPANESMLRLIERTDGHFRISYAATGVAVEQLKQYAPEVMDSFVRLAKTGAVEFIAETYYHSLAALYDMQEYREQIQIDVDLIQSEFGQTPSQVIDRYPALGELSFHRTVSWARRGSRHQRLARQRDAAARAAEIYSAGAGNPMTQ